MANKVLIGIAALVAIVDALAPDLAGAGIASLLLVLVGLIYAALAWDPEDATGELIVAVAVGAAAGADVLNHIPAIGGHLDAIVGHLSTVLYAGVATVLAMRILNRLKG